MLKDLATLADGSFRFGFTNIPSAAFTVIAATNITSAQSEWTILGSPTEVSSGQFRFTDSEASANPQRFYRVRSP